MNPQGAYQRYKQVQVETANQGKLVYMLYKGCVKFIRLAKKSLDDEDYQSVNNYLIRAQDIINELKLSQDEIGVIIVNKKIETSNAVVYHGDVVEFYPLFGGG